jgi:uncharacterized membrane protein YfcA
LLFPVVGQDLDTILIFAVGLLGGFISGFFGVGSGVVITPALIEIGLPTPIAVSNQLCHGVGVSTTNFLSYKRKCDVDFHLAAYILLGGFIGAAFDWFIFQYLNGASSTSDIFILAYIVILSVVGCIMLVQGAKEWKRKDAPRKYSPGVMMRRWMVYLPFHTIFIRSRTEMSIFIPVFIGFLAGMLAPSLGGGSSLFMIPIITYLIGRISPVVNGTTSFTGCIITGIVTLTRAYENCYCDILFVLILFTGAAIGTWIGVGLAYNIRRCYINVFAALIVFMMASRQVFRLMSDYSALNMYATADKSDLKIFHIAFDSPIMYTITCIAIMVIVAIISERLLQKIANKRKNKTIKSPEK